MNIDRPSYKKEVRRFLEKYVVVKILNSTLDACSIQANVSPSGVCVCSTGDKTPWVFVESGIYENKDNAMYYARLLFEQLFSELRSNGISDGCDIVDNGEGCIFTVHIDEDGTRRSVWVAKVTVLEIPTV